MFINQIKLQVWKIGKSHRDSGKENLVDIYERIEDIKSNLNNGRNNGIAIIIDSQPSVNKKKKKMRSFW